MRKKPRKKTKKRCKKSAHLYLNGITQGAVGTEVNAKKRVYSETGYPKALRYGAKTRVYPEDNPRQKGYMKELLHNGAFTPKITRAKEGSPLSREIVYCLSMAVKITQREEKR